MRKDDAALEAALRAYLAGGYPATREVYAGVCDAAVAVLDAVLPQQAEPHGVEARTRRHLVLYRCECQCARRAVRRARSFHVLGDREAMPGRGCPSLAGGRRLRLGRGDDLGGRGRGDALAQRAGGIGGCLRIAAE